MNSTLLKVTGMVSWITFCPMKWVTPVSKLVNFWHLKFIWAKGTNNKPLHKWTSSNADLPTSLIANDAYDMNFTLLKITGMVSRITFCPMKWVTPVSKLVNFWHLKFIYGTHFLIRYLQLISLYHTVTLIASFHFMKTEIKLLSKCWVFLKSVSID